MNYETFPHDADVAVRGWVEEPTDARRDAWIARYSDHSLLYLELVA